MRAHCSHRSGTRIECALAPQKYGVALRSVEVDLDAGRILDELRNRPVEFDGECAGVEEKAVDDARGRPTTDPVQSLHQEGALTGEGEARRRGHSAYAGADH